METIQRRIIIAVTIICFMILLSFSSGIAKTLTIKEVKFGVVLPLTGSVAFDGKLTLEGITLAAEEINAKGGIGGVTKIKLVTEDSRCVPAESVNAVTKLISVNRVAAVIGDFCSSCTLANMPIAQREQVPLITPISIAPKITQQGNKWVFRACDSSKMMANAFTKFAVEDLNVKRWAFIAVNDDQGRSSVAAFSKLVEKFGGKIVFAEYHEHGETDYYPILTSLKAKKVDGLGCFSQVQDGSRFVNQWAELGLNREMKLLDTGGGFLSEKFIELTKPHSEGMIAVTRFADAIDTPRAKKFVKAYKKRWGRSPEKYAQSGYDTISIVSQAIARAGSIKSADIRDALTKTDYEGPQGKAYFDSTNQLIIGEYIVTLEKGKWTVLAGPIKAVD